MMNCYIGCQVDWVMKVTQKLLQIFSLRTLFLHKSDYNFTKNTAYEMV